MDTSATVGTIRVDPQSSVWSLLALTDDDLEQVDLVIVNLAVARGIKSLNHLEVEKYIKIVDEWADEFRRFLPGSEARNFNRAPEKWHGDIHFFRMGMLAGFLGSIIGVAYIEEQKNLERVAYTNPSDLFLNGVIDTKRGTCANLAQLHVAIARRMGWPVSICSAADHWLSRFDNGKVAHTIETSKIDDSGCFAADTDEWYQNKFQLPEKAVECGSELRRLTAREMIGAFAACRGRHHIDTCQNNLADLDYSLSRHLFPNHRRTYMRAVSTMLRVGNTLFELGETGHTDTIFEDLAPAAAPSVYARKSGMLGVRTNNPFAQHVPEIVVAAGCFSAGKVQIQRS
ncbi:MAG TPA: transglutaminase family protein [Tepidisphaeraceae bacterium]|nr:transglutaminase family protein [Tepidisphaeraceae bacterium]